MKAKPPNHLTTEAKALWSRVNRDYSLADDIAGLSLLLGLCETLDRLRQCQGQIKADGLVTSGSQGQLRPHPLLSVEAECRRLLLSHFRALRLEPEDY